MKTSMRILLIITLILAFFAITYGNRMILISSPEPKGKTETDLRTVKVARVKQAHPISEIRFSGMTRAVNRAKLSFTIGERLVSRPVEVGDHVRVGQMLARLDERKISNALAEAQASLAEIEARIKQVNRDHERYKALVDANASAAVELEKIIENRAVLFSAKAAAEARLTEAERLLKETVLTAPFPATVTEVLLEPGEYAVPGGPVVVLSGDGAVEIQVEVPESLISKLSVGERVDVDLPLAGEQGLEGRIEYRGRSALGSGRLFPVLVGLAPESGAIPGMTAEVVFRTRNETSLSVPLSAIVNPGGQMPELFKVENGRVHKIPVKVGRIVGDGVAIQGGLKPGDMVVSGGHLALLDGDRVKVVENECF